MDLTNQAIHDVIHPTAIFCDTTDNDSQENESTKGSDDSWNDSQLNPKNRIDSLDPPKQCLWRIDGCAGLGTHFYAIPLFLEDIPPMRIDLYLDPDVTEAPKIRKLLDMDMVFHARDRVRLQRTGICSYILRALQAWTMKNGRDAVEALYRNGPFGSRIYFANLPLNVEDVDIDIAYDYDAELRQKTREELANMWEGTVKSMPPTVDINKLAFVKQLHDSVCVVRYLEDSEGIEAPTLWVMKALTSSFKYMYHELRVLLTMPPHLNIISTPSRLVTNRGSLIKNREVVVGFLVPFHSGGGLRDELPLLRMHGLLRIEDQARWAKDICSGLLHIRNQGRQFYPDLRLDQIVFPADRKRPILLDFEQRGVWCEFGAPEINAIEYLLMVADEEPDDGPREKAAMDCGFGLDGALPSFRNFRQIAQLFQPDTWKPRSRTKHYENPPSGYNIPWNYITREEQEFAEVYMLGRLLWCLFEGLSAPQRGAVWCSYRCEPEFDFPEYRRTPPVLRELIEKCTRGRRGQLSSRVIRKGNKIVLRDDLRGDGTPEMIKSVAKEFWVNEVRWAEEFVLNREKAVAEGTWNNNHFDRPTLSGVHRVLETFERGLDSSIHGG